jgi:hypothetical protein
MLYLNVRKKQGPDPGPEHRVQVEPQVTYLALTMHIASLF